MAHTSMVPMSAPSRASDSESSRSVEYATLRHVLMPCRFVNKKVRMYVSDEVCARGKASD